MNKRLIRMLATAAILVLFAATFVFADGESFRIVGTSPEDGSTNTVAQNVAVKLIFSEDVSLESAREANDKIFTIKTTVKNEDGKEETTEIPYTALYNNEKYPNELWLQCDQDLVPTQTYVVTVPASMKSSDGDSLGEEYKLTFTVRDTKRDNTIYTVMMLLFMVLMIAMSVRDAARQARGDAKQQKKDVSVNPYKEAKKKGKSVAEINAATEKKKAKILEQERKREALKEELRKEIAEERKKVREKSRKKRYRVMKASPISKAGFRVSESYLKSLHKK